MKRSRWNELLAIPDEIRHPNLYQMLGLTETPFEHEKVEPAFKERMQKLQSLRSTKHKEFLEFAKGELRRALRVLSNQDERRAYDAELREERAVELKRFLAPVLAGGVLIRGSERALLATAVRELGMTEVAALEVIETELLLSGAVRIEAAGPQPLHVPSGDDTGSEEEIQPPRPVAPRMTRRHKTNKTAKANKTAPHAVLATVRFCAACGSSIPERWRKTGEAERVGARLLCSTCSAPIRAGRACAGCSRTFEVGEKVHSAGGTKRICSKCGAYAKRLKVCAGCGVVLPPKVIERGGTHERDGKVWCAECHAARAS